MSDGYRATDLSSAKEGHRRALVAGWFSFEYGHATAGDLYTRDLACAWLEEAGLGYDIAVDPPFSGGIDWRQADPENYSHVLFVCGPFEKRDIEIEFLDRFATCRLVGLNLSMAVSLDEWNPFDFLIERDSSRAVHPDMVFLSREAHVPVVGVCLVEDYPGADVIGANTAIQRLRDTTNATFVSIDTRLDTNSTGLRNPAEIESLFARMDAVVTTRLHGMVLALKNGVPVVAIDPERGGAKIRRQAERIEWPVIFNVDQVSEKGLGEALEYCLTDSARAEARRRAERSAEVVMETRERFLSALADPIALEEAFRARTRTMAKNPVPPGQLQRHPIHQPYLRTRRAISRVAGRGKEAVRLVARPVVEPIWRWLST